MKHQEILKALTLEQKVPCSPGGCVEHLCLSRGGHPQHGAL